MASRNDKMGMTEGDRAGVSGLKQKIGQSGDAEIGANISNRRSDLHAIAREVLGPERYWQWLMGTGGHIHPLRDQDVPNHLQEPLRRLRDYALEQKWFALPLAWVVEAGYKIPTSPGSTGRKAGHRWIVTCKRTGGKMCVTDYICHTRMARESDSWQVSWDGKGKPDAYVDAPPTRRLIVFFFPGLFLPQPQPETQKSFEKVLDDALICQFRRRVGFPETGGGFGCAAVLYAILESLEKLPKSARILFHRGDEFFTDDFVEGKRLVIRLEECDSSGDKIQVLYLDPPERATPARTHFFWAEEI